MHVASKEDTRKLHSSPQLQASRFMPPVICQEFTADDGKLASHATEVGMKEFIGSKAVIGIVTSTAITGSMVTGLYFATNAQPEHWRIEALRDTAPVQVQLLPYGTAAGDCDWVRADSRERLAKCPAVIVTARRAVAEARVADARARGAVRND
jgi:hypothetical protein